MAIKEQIGGDFGITIIYTPDEKYKCSVKFYAAEVDGIDDDGLRYTRKGGITSVDSVHDPREAERFIEGSVKYDGCSHVSFGDETGYLHLCGREDFNKLSAGIMAIYDRCLSIMREQGTYILDDHE